MPGTDTHSVPSSLCCWWEHGHCGGRDPCQVSCVIPCPVWPCWMLMWCRSRRPYAVAPALKRSPCTPPRGPRQQLPTSCSCETATSWRVRGLLSARQVRAETFQLVAGTLEITLLSSPCWKRCIDKGVNFHCLNLLSAAVSRRRGSVPTLSVCDLRAISGAPWWPRLCVLCRPWSVVTELSDRHWCKFLPKRKEVFWFWFKGFVSDVRRQNKRHTQIQTTQESKISKKELKAA